MLAIRERSGEYLITAKSNGIVVREFHVKNRLMDVVLNAEIELLKGLVYDLEIKYLALGTGTVPITNTDSALNNETHRFPPTSGPTTTATGEVTTEWTLTETDAQIHIKEIGIFSGSTATSSAGTGTLISRILWDFDKTSNVELIIKRIDRVVR